MQTLRARRQCRPYSFSCGAGDSPVFANVRAKTAPNAHRTVDHDRMANFAPPQRRTTDGGDAFAATCARVRDEVNRGLRFGELRAGRFVDDRRRAIVVDRFARCFYSLIGEQRIGLRDLLHAKCAEHFLDRDRRTELVLLKVQIIY